MTAEFPVLVRFKRALIITLILSGGAIFLSSTLSFLAGHFPFGFVASFAFIFAGVSLQRHTYFRLDRHELIVYKPTGKEDYRCALASLRDLDIDAETDDVYLLSAGDCRKMPLYHWLAEDEDWEIFRALVMAANPDMARETDSQLSRSDQGELAIEVEASQGAIHLDAVESSSPSEPSGPSSTD